MTNARQKILSYIIQQQTATVEDLSKVFGVTPANIRHHLSILVGQGSLKIIGQKAQAGKGRPSQVYSASQQFDQNNLEQLTDSLLTTFLGELSAAHMNTYLRDIAQKMANKAVLDKHNPTRRLYSSIRALNRMSYRAHWEAHYDTPRIMMGHCPYLTLLNAHPEMCHLCAFLLQELTGTPVHQAEKLAVGAKGLAECVFLLNRRESTH